MNLRSLLFPPIAKAMHQQFLKEHTGFQRNQEQQFLELLRKIQRTKIGQELNLNSIHTYDEYRKTIPFQNYQSLKPFIFLAAQGERDVLWPGSPIAFALTAGTTSEQKYIPVTIETIRSHKRGRTLAISNYSVLYNQWEHLKGPLMYFTGQLETQHFGKFNANLISSLLINSTPNWYRNFNLPSPKVAATLDFTERIVLMLEEALKNRKNLRGIVSFPPWFSMFLDQFEKENIGDFQDLFPNFNLLVTSGLSYANYKHKIGKQIGNSFDRLETYPTSEGFLGFTRHKNDIGFSILPRNGIFYEFINVKDIAQAHPQRYWIDEIVTGIEYAILLTTNSGLLSYLLGDTVLFIENNPPKFIITGRLNTSISAIDEEIKVSHTNSVISQLSKELNLTIHEYCVAALKLNEPTKPKLSWIIAVNENQSNLQIIQQKINALLMQENIQYASNTTMGRIDLPDVLLVNRYAFYEFMKAQGGSHFQQKTQHLQPDIHKFNHCLQFMQGQIVR